MKTALLLSLLALAVADENNDCVGEHCKGSGYGYGARFDDAGTAISKGYGGYSGSFGYGPGVSVAHQKISVPGGFGIKGSFGIAGPAMKPGFAFRRMVMPGYGMQGYGMPGYGMSGYGMSGYGMSGYRMPVYGTSGYGASYARFPVYGGYDDDVSSVEFSGPAAVGSKVISGARVGFGGGFSVGGYGFRPVFRGYPSYPKAVSTMAGYGHVHNGQVYNAGFPGVGVSVGAIKYQGPQYGTESGVGVATSDDGFSVGTAGVGLERNIDDGRYGVKYVSDSYSQYPKVVNNGWINAGGIYPIGINPGRQCTCKSKCGWGETYAGGCPWCKKCTLIMCCKVGKKY